MKYAKGTGIRQICLSLELYQNLDDLLGELNKASVQDFHCYLAAENAWSACKAGATISCMSLIQLL